MKGKDMTTSRHVSTHEFRATLRHYPTGVALITSRDEERAPVGLVVGSFTAVSLDPLLVGFLADHSSTTWPHIRRAGRFCVNVLGSHQESVCRAFTTKDPTRFDRLVDADVRQDPHLEGAIMWIDCQIETVLEVGDHDFVVGAVRDVRLADEPNAPLVFVRGGYAEPRSTETRTGHCHVAADRSLTA
ncbi:flavin reductase family protein [Nonomuraea sp. NPDC050783]|uniref:flavin reductase family protein n=1 Tax=Nonomuraea sp. NPDC050783 TaxID=3154634 RepID=UPI003465632E